MKKWIFAIALVFVGVACEKNKVEDPAIVCKTGYIYWGGDYAIDGIGWYFAENRANGLERYQLKETELPALYKTSFTDSTAVKICLTKTTERAPCFCSAPSYFYSIQSIQKN